MSQASQPLAQTVSAQSPSAPTSANSQSSKRVGKGKEVLQIPEMEISVKKPILDDFQTDFFSNCFEGLTSFENKIRIFEKT